jgi:superfamily II helicase
VLQILEGYIIRKERERTCRNVPRDESICQKCSENEIEDEVHFLIKCSENKVVREQLFLLISQKCKN